METESNTPSNNGNSIVAGISSLETESNTPSNNGNSIVAGISSLVVLIVIIVMVTSLLNNKSISALETRTDQLETNLQSLQTDFSTLLTESPTVSPTVDDSSPSPVDNIEVLKEAAPIEEPTPVKSEDKITHLKVDKIMVASNQLGIPNLGETSNDSKINKLETQLKTVTGKVNLFNSKLNQQANSLQSTLKNETKILAKLQNNTLKSLEKRLQSIAKNMVKLQQESKQLNSKMSKMNNVTSQVKSHDSTIEILTVKLQTLTDKIANVDKNEQIQKLDQKIDLQISQLKTTLEADVATKFQKQNAKIAALETQLQMLIGGLTSSIGQ